MTEGQWLKCTDPNPMLDYLRDKVSERKRRLFACACCRHIWPLITNKDCRRAVEVAERYADGLVSESERSIAEYLVSGEDVDDAIPPAEVADNWAVVSADDEVLDPEEDFALLTATIAASAARHPDRERASQGSLAHDIFGNPFRPVTEDPTYLTRNVTDLAEAIYSDRTFDRLPILADVLEDAGCTNQDILAHCRSGGEHFRGCWVLDLLLGKN